MGVGSMYFVIFLQKVIRVWGHHELHVGYGDSS